MLLESNGEAVEKILAVSLSEWAGVGEAGSKGLGVGMVLDSFNYVSESLGLQVLLGQNSMNVRTIFCDVTQVSLVDVTRVHWVTQESLVVWNWPGWSGHHSERMVSLWDH